MPAHAGLVGSTVQSQYYFSGGTYGSSMSFTVDGANRGSTIGFFDIQVTDNQVIYDYVDSNSWNHGSVWNSGALHIENGNLLNFFGASDILGVTLDATSNMAGFDASRISFDADSIAVDWAGLAFNGNTRVVLNVNTLATADVPEPASYALVLTALAGAMLVRRRKA